MSIKEEKRFDKKIFDYITCPVCGCKEWTEIRYHGVFCNRCNTEVRINTTTGDAGFMAEFNCDCVYAAEAKCIIPDQCHATAKILQVGEEYVLEYINCWSPIGDIKWKPVWEK